MTNEYRQTYQNHDPERPEGVSDRIIVDKPPLEAFDRFAPVIMIVAPEHKAEEEKELYNMLRRNDYIAYNDHSVTCISDEPDEEVLFPYLNQSHVILVLYDEDGTIPGNPTVQQLIKQSAEKNNNVIPVVTSPEEVSMIHRDLGRFATTTWNFVDLTSTRTLYNMHSMMEYLERIRTGEMAPTLGQLTHIPSLEAIEHVNDTKRMIIESDVVKKIDLDDTFFMIFAPEHRAQEEKTVIQEFQNNGLLLLNDISIRHAYSGSDKELLRHVSKTRYIFVIYDEHGTIPGSSSIKESLQESSFMNRNVIPVFMNPDDLDTRVHLSGIHGMAWDKTFSGRHATAKEDIIEQLLRL